MISLMLDVGFYSKELMENYNDTIELSPMFKLEVINRPKFMQAMMSPCCQTKIETFLQSDIGDSVKCIDSAVNDLSEIINQACRIAELPCKKGNVKKSNKTKKNKKWYDKECLVMYRELKTTATHLHKQPFSMSLLNKYRKLRKDYKKLLRKKKSL